MCSTGSWHGDPHHPPPGQRALRPAFPSGSSFHRIPAAVDGDRLRPGRTRPGRGRWAFERRPRGRRADADHGLVRVEARRSHVLPGQHVERRRAGPVEGRHGLSARQDLGLRPGQRLGVGRLQRRLRHRRGGRYGTDQAEGPVPRPERRLPARRHREGADLFPPHELRAVSQSAKPRRDIRRRVRQHQDHPAPPGRPAAEVLRAVLGMVPHPEDALLPLCLVVEPVAGRPGAGRGRGQPDLGLQPLRERRGRHHLAADACAAPKASSPTGSAWTIA